MNAISLAFRGFACRVSNHAARASIFVVYFWFGSLKLWNASPAAPLVKQLLGIIFQGTNPQSFLVALGVVEMLIGASFLRSRISSWSFLAIIAHLAATSAPLFLLPGLTWTGFMLPSMEGQYIIKNLLIGSGVLCLAGGTTSREPKPLRAPAGS